MDDSWPVDDYGRAGRSAEATVAQLTMSVRETVFPLRKGRGENGKNMMYMYICMYIYIHTSKLFLLYRDVVYDI